MHEPPPAAISKPLVDIFDKWVCASKAKQNEVTQLGTKMYIENALINWYFHRLHRLPQRERCTGMIQTTRLVHHMLVKLRRDLVRMFIVHRPHRPDNRTKSRKLHRRCEIDYLVRTLFVSDGRVTSGEIREFRILQIALDDALDREVSVVESKCRLE